MGRASLARNLGLTDEESYELNRAYRKALPGVKDLQDEIKGLVKRGKPIITIGGRQYFCEEPHFSKKYGKIMTFEYKLLNYLVQGSAADHAKRAFIRVAKAMKKYDGRILVQQHDEFLNTAPEPHKKEIMAAFREAMDFKYFEIITPSDGKMGRTWGTMKEYKERIT